jgi:hypothetical protein
LPHSMHKYSTSVMVKDKLNAYLIFFFWDKIFFKLMFDV